MLVVPRPLLGDYGVVCRPERTGECPLHGQAGYMLVKTYLQCTKHDQK